MIRTALGLLFLLPALTLAQPGGTLLDSIRSCAVAFGGRIGVAAEDLRTGEIVACDADSLFPTASVIKLPVLVELFWKFHDGELSPQTPVPLLDSLRKPGSGVLQFLEGGQTLKLVDLATLMIILSDNTATNYVIDQLGSDHESRLEAVNGRMRSLGLSRTKLLNKLYGFATKKKTEEARRFGIGVSCPADMRRLLAEIARGTLLDGETSTAILSMLRKQQDGTMAARYLPIGADSTLAIGNKTGSLDQVKNDVGIVTGNQVRYVYAIFCDGSREEGEGVDNAATLAVARVSRLLFEHFLRQEAKER